MEKLISRVRKRKKRKRGQRGKQKAIKVRAPITETKIKKAIKGSYGNIAVIARILDRPYATVYAYIKRAPALIREAIREEKERMADVAEKTVEDMITQRLDYGVASRTAKWYLERKHSDRGYMPKKENIIEGGNNPIRVQNHHLISVEELKTIDLPTRRKLLKEIEEKDTESE